MLLTGFEPGLFCYTVRVTTDKGTVVEKCGFKSSKYRNPLKKYNITFSVYQNIFLTNRVRISKSKDEPIKVYFLTKNMTPLEDTYRQM